MNYISAEMKDSDFDRISKLVYEQCGIHLHDGKKELVKARLGKRLREGNFRSFAEYYGHVTTREGQEELITMIDSISTNLTYFFREESHFRKLEKILPKLAENKKLNLWCAGCSTGEEPYSIAMTVREHVNPGIADVKILATDISTKVLKTAQTAVYSADRIDKIPQPLLRKYFQYGTGNSSGLYRVKKDLRALVEFRRLNLIEPFPQQFRFHVIFCRNVMIYFDKATQSVLVNKYYEHLEKGGYLFVGHSESLTGLSHPFKYSEPSIYIK
ncbi:MAG: protein-glutamate O-methyltransferase [Syntrophus sp. (in: bacteria)]